jgi:hypothetical protein
MLRPAAVQAPLVPAIDGLCVCVYNVIKIVCRVLRMMNHRG